LNRPIPIGFDKTISVILEIGTGLGYQSAVLAELASRVYSVEIIEELAQRAIRRLKQQHQGRSPHRQRYAGWPEHAPFDKVMVTAAPDLSRSL
jgi:protein-L-isoaspartate(D-aspartate) O-methyltransferase